MSMKRSGILIFSLLIMCIIVLLTLRGCSLSKKSNENGIKNNSSEVVLTDKAKANKKENKKDEGAKKEGEISENIPSKAENTEVKGSKNPNLEKPEKKEELGVAFNKSAEKEESSNLFLEIEDPVLGGNMSVNALVASKKAYIVDDKSYAYSLGILIPNGDKYVPIHYYCPKKTYDAIKAGDNVKVDYQIDKGGKVSINAISK